MRERKEKQVAILVPVYKERLSKLEQISLNQLIRVLGEYPIFFVGPQGLKVDYGKSTEDIPLVGFQQAYFSSVAGYSRLLLNPAFYRAFEEYEYVLIYQLDAFVFTDRLEEFCSLGYDYWGAPVHGRGCNYFWQALGLRVGNGGLSLRKVSSAIRALEENKEWVSNSPFRDVLEGWEDLFWSSLGGREDYDFTCPPINLAIQFSVQDDVCHAFKNFKKNNTFGCHGWNKPEELAKWQSLIAEAGYEQIKSVEVNKALPSWRERLVREYIFHRRGVNVNLLIGLTKRKDFAKATALVTNWLDKYPDGSAEWYGSAEALLTVMKLGLCYDRNQTNRNILKFVSQIKQAIFRTMSAPGFYMWTGYMVEDLIEFAGWTSAEDAALLKRLGYIREAIETNVLLQNIHYNLHLVEIGLNVQAAVDWLGKLLSEREVSPEQLVSVAKSATRNPDRVLQVIIDGIESAEVSAERNDAKLDSKTRICFVACVNDDNQFENFCMNGLRHLKVPDDVSVEILTIRGAKSMAAGYEEARQASDAKYKVYLHQDLEITNENFISDMLAEFRRDKNVGLIGMIGTKRLHPDCNWWDRTGENLVGGAGQVFAEREYHNLDLHGLMNDDWEQVEAVDGILMATQYDVPWRTDIMDSWHFYDVSQCLEYIRAGYKVMVPRQKPLWTLHHRPAQMRDGWLPLWDKYRRRVMLEYIEEILPSARLNDKEILLVVCDHEGSADKIQAKYGYLARLAVPAGYHLSIEVISDNCPAWSFGSIQKASIAKYKIYLDGNAKIVNNRCVVELLKIFVTNQAIGAVGVSEGMRGTVDRCFVATQYDIPWDDIRYPGNMYAAEAMCLDMKLKGYEVIVANQDKPWVVMEPRKTRTEEIIKPWAENHLRSNGVWRVGSSSEEIFLEEYGAIL